MGTSTVRGDIWLTVTHDTTSYVGATGVAAGTSSASGDTIIGTSHKLTIDLANSKVKLDSGSFVAYDTGTDDDLRLQNSAGDVVYVDMTGLTATPPPDTVEVDIIADGKLSIDDGATTVDLTAFSNNEKVTDSLTDRILYVDATAITRTGVEPVQIAGTYDVFDALISIRDLLLNERGLSAAQQGDMLRGDVMESLDEVIGGVLNQMTTLGSRMQAMDRLQTSMVDIKLGVDARQSQLQDADIIQLATELTRTQVFYEMILVATSRVLKVSLLDYI